MQHFDHENVVKLLGKIHHLIYYFSAQGNIRIFLEKKKRKKDVDVGMS